MAFSQLTHYEFLRDVEGNLSAQTKRQHPMACFAVPFLVTRWQSKGTKRSEPSTPPQHICFYRTTRRRHSGGTRRQSNSAPCETRGAPLQRLFTSQTARRHSAETRSLALGCEGYGLIPQVQRVWHANMQIHGAEKGWKQFNRHGSAVARCNLDGQLGLSDVRRGKVAGITVFKANAPCPLDRVNRQFKAERPNQLWVSDFTYVSTWQGWLYVAFVVDVFARRIVGWRVSSSITQTFSWTLWSKPCLIGRLSALHH